MNTDYALLIGINDYTPPKNLGLPSLNGAVNDANYFEDWLLNPDGGNLNKQNVFKVTSTPNPLQPLQYQIDAELRKILALIKDNGGKARRFYFYFAGHGLGVDADTTDNALCMADWSERDGRRSALSAKEYRELLIKLGYFEEIVFLADCCRNTKINIRPFGSAIETIMAAATSGNTRFFIGYATQFQDQSKEIEDSTTGEKRGAFTKVLLEGLQGKAINEQGNAIDADSLRDYLIRFVPIEAQKKGFKQTPDIYHSFNAINPLIFKHFDPAVTINCHFQFIASRAGIISLIDEFIDEVETFDLSVAHTFSRYLKPGTYVFIEKQTKAKKRFVLTPNKIEENVEF